MNIPLLGPNLRLATDADPSDCRFEICFIGDSRDEREALARWLLRPDTADAPVAVRRAERATITGQFRRVRLDGHLWMPEPLGDAENTAPITLAIEPEPLFFLVPG